MALEGGGAATRKISQAFSCFAPCISPPAESKYRRCHNVFADSGPLGWFHPDRKIGSKNFLPINQLIKPS